MIDKNKLNDVERGLLEGLEQLVRELKAGTPIDRLVLDERRAKLLDALNAFNKERGVTLKKRAE